MYIIADNAIVATQELDMRLYLTLWIDQNPASFENEFWTLQNLIAKRDFHNVDGIIVGSEVLYRGDATIPQLLDYIQHVKDLVAGKGIPITSADTFNKMVPEIVAPLDFVMINVFPYWEGVSIDRAVDQLMAHYDETVNRVGSKVVKISESGWPSQGEPVGAAVASPENQNRYLREVLCRTRQRGIDMLWFSAIDEPYKQDVEGHFGIFDTFTRSLKPFHRVSQLSAC
ncbi:glycoside hydrolase superfamily [Phascolomyces articulosus]|uniref:glucan endo-1,3-beta-D-glucosidase n=1 Tax=Phascolomyces articulosus TaxID=60185 RepID=A0AAD5PFJ2_9FUNG|nr:glycoside hydrolase superfamily [Phascolomyces articulosus]